MLKISKSTSKTIKGSEDLIPVCQYDEALQHIRKAIDCLGPCADSDDRAREAIADLAVVYAGLRGNE